MQMVILISPHFFFAREKFNKNSSTKFLSYQKICKMKTVARIPVSDPDMHCQQNQISCC